MAGTTGCTIESVEEKQRERKGEEKVSEKKRCQDPFSLDSQAIGRLLCVMGRPHRHALGGYVYHVLNRANGRLPIFQKESDYAAFERILGQALEHVPGVRLLAYCLLPNHWHLVVWPRRDGGRAVRFWPLADAHPYAALARPIPRRGHGALIPGALQVLPDRGRRTLSARLPLRGTQCLTRRPGPAGRGLSLVQFVAASAQGQARQVDFEPVAGK